MILLGFFMTKMKYIVRISNIEKKKGKFLVEKKIWAV
jgi:hypothetical protein